MEDREINLVELALATNIPKGCAETMVRGKAGIISEIYSDLAIFKKIYVICFVSSAVNVSYLDGKGNLEPQGTGKPQISEFLLI